MKKLNVVRTAVAAAMLVAGAANASVVNWTITGGKFDDGTSFAGSFGYDATTGTYSSWNISVGAGGIFTDFLYAETGGVGRQFVGAYSANGADFVSNRNPVMNRFVHLAFASALTDAGGTIGLLTGGDRNRDSYECDNCGTYRYVTAGQVTTVQAAAVPEPATLALVGAALVAIRASRRKAA